jgi:hypothetical protein
MTVNGRTAENSHETSEVTTVEKGDIKAELDQLKESHEELLERHQQLQTELLFRGLNINRC